MGQLRTQGSSCHLECPGPSYLFCHTGSECERQNSRAIFHQQLAWKAAPKSCLPFVPSLSGIAKVSASRFLGLLLNLGCKGTFGLRVLWKWSLPAMPKYGPGELQGGGNPGCNVITKRTTEATLQSKETVLVQLKGNLQFEGEICAFPMWPAHWRTISLRVPSAEEGRMESWWGGQSRIGLLILGLEEVSLHVGFAGPKYMWVNVYFISILQISLRTFLVKHRISKNLLWEECVRPLLI